MIETGMRRFGMVLFGLVAAACQTGPSAPPFTSPGSSILASDADTLGLPSLVSMSEFDSELGVQATVVRQNGCTFGILSWNKKGPDSKWFILPMTLGLSVPDLFDHGAEVESRSGRDAGPEGDDYVYADSGFVTKRNGQVTTVGHFRTLRTGYRMCLMFAGGPPTAIDDAKCAAWINAIRTGRDAHDSDARDLIARLHLGE